MTTTPDQGFELVRVAPPASFYLMILCLIVIVALWGLYIERRFAKCRCDRKPTLLRPKWKKVDHKEDHDRYSDE